jgi:hypothetical protein
MPLALCQTTLPTSLLLSFLSLSLCNLTISPPENDFCVSIKAPSGLMFFIDPSISWLFRMNDISKG